MADLRAHQAKMEATATPKYRNKIVLVQGIRFDSKKEADHWLLLQMRERIHEINSLERQPVFPLYIERDGGRIDIGKFTADFRYFERFANGAEVLRVIDVKSPVSKTEAYQLRKKIAEAIYGITITEV